MWNLALILHKLCFAVRIIPVSIFPAFVSTLPSVFAIAKKEKKECRQRKAARRVLIYYYLVFKLLFTNFPCSVPFVPGVVGQNKNKNKKWTIIWRSEFLEGIFFNWLLPVSLLPFEIFVCGIRLIEVLLCFAFAFCFCCQLSSPILDYILGCGFLLLY